MQLECKFCKSLTSKITELKNGKKFYHCSNCYFTGLSPEFFPNIEEEKHRYDLHENSIENSGYRKIFENLIDFGVKPYKVQSILDYGSGPNPVLAELLIKEGYLVEIYDPFYAPNKLGNKSFDLVISTEVVEHFHEPLIEFEKMLEHLRPKGYLVLLTRFLPELDQFKSWFYKDDFTHVSFYCPKSFEHLAKIFNLKIVKHDNFQSIVMQKN